MNRVIVYRHHMLPKSETFIRQQLLALTQWQPSLVGESLIDGGLPLHGIDIVQLRPQGALHDLGYRACRLLAAPHAASARKLQRIDAKLAHVHFGTDAVDIWPTIKAAGLPMLVTLHGYDITIARSWWEHGHGGPRRRLYPARLLALAREPGVRFLAVSEHIRRCATAYGIPSEKVAVHHIGVDTSAFTPGETPICKRPKQVLFVGRLVEKKGAEYLVRAFARVRDAIEEARLVIVGDGPLRASLEAMAITLNVPVTFTGMLDSHGVKQQMDQARVFCLPSVTAANGDAEGFGLVLLEAQANGLPVISSAKGGAYEGIIHDSTGFAFEERDVERLAELIADFLRNDALATEMAANAREFATASFDIINCTRALEAIYEQHAASS